ncbi:MAG TPA: hypothetical protein VN704_01705 [Verrucomicrobiae bacterium]|nr:hypothetical protein [Verrucomicrobiae bacterium]
MEDREPKLNNKPSLKKTNRKNLNNQDNASPALYRRPYIDRKSLLIVYLSSYPVKKLHEVNKKFQVLNILQKF